MIAATSANGAIPPTPAPPALSHPQAAETPAHTPEPTQPANPGAVRLAAIAVPITVHAVGAISLLFPAIHRCAREAWGPAQASQFGPETELQAHNFQWITQQQIGRVWLLFSAPAIQRRLPRGQH